MRKTDNFVRKMQINGFYRDIELSDPEGDTTSVKTKYNDLTGVTEVSESDIRIILEMHVELDIEGFEDKGKDEPQDYNSPMSSQSMNHQENPFNLPYSYRKIH